MLELRRWPGVAGRLVGSLGTKTFIGFVISTTGVSETTQVQLAS